jgi:hypothetical protein
MSGRPTRLAVFLVESNRSQALGRAPAPRRRRRPCQRRYRDGGRCRWRSKRCPGERLLMRPKNATGSSPIGSTAKGSWLSSTQTPLPHGMPPTLGRQRGIATAPTSVRPRSAPVTCSPTASRTSCCARRRACAAMASRRCVSTSTSPGVRRNRPDRSAHLRRRRRLLRHPRRARRGCRARNLEAS